MAENRAHFLALIGQPPGEASRNRKYDPEHCFTVRRLAQEGSFPETWAATIGVTLPTMREWVRTHDEFRESVIIAHHLLQDFWAKDIAANRKNPDAKVGLYALIVRRFPALYGRNPIDLAAWLTEPDAPAAVPAAGTAALGQDTPAAGPVSGMNTNDIEARLEALRRRREAAAEE